MSRRFAAPALPASASPGARTCSVLASVATMGDFWTLGVLRCASYQVRRFADFQRELGVASNVLTDRLARLVDAGVLTRQRYQDRPPRYEYLLTDAGRELAPVVLALKAWGDKHLQPNGPYTVVSHTGCRSSVEVVIRCRDCGDTVIPEDLETVSLR